MRSYLISYTVQETIRGKENETNTETRKIERINKSMLIVCHSLPEAIKELKEKEDKEYSRLEQITYIYSE